MRYIIYGAAIVLAVLHQDFWYWDDPTLVWGGVMPIGLAYHLIFSIVSGVLWSLAVVFAWPHGVEEEVKEALAEMENSSTS
jgi:hypothetical protein